MWTTENRARYDRNYLRYPSDLTDAEWALIEPGLPPAKPGGNKRTVNLRQTSSNCNRKFITCPCLNGHHHRPVKRPATTQLSLRRILTAFARREKTQSGGTKALMSRSLTYHSMARRLDMATLTTAGATTASGDTTIARQRRNNFATHIKVPPDMTGMRIDHCFPCPSAWWPIHRSSNLNIPRNRLEWRFP
jgi:transposase